MGKRGEVFSTRIFADEGRKTFFFNVKENRYHDTYLNIVESRKTDRNFKRSSIVVFLEDINSFVKVLDKALMGIREDLETVDEVLSVGGGRREYRLRRAARNRRVLQISETREDSSGYRREGIYLEQKSMDMLMTAFEKSLCAMRNSRKDGKVQRNADSL